MMRAVKKAKIRYASGDEVDLVLLRRRDKAYFWARRVGQDLRQATPWDDREHPNETQAIRDLRLSCDEIHGSDLTIFPAEDPPEVRAAKMVIGNWYQNLDDQTVSEAADIIAEETACTELCHALNELCTYMILRLGVKDPGLNPFLLQGINAVSKATGDPLTNQKERYENAIKEANQLIKAASSSPDVQRAAAELRKKIERSN